MSLLPPSHSLQTYKARRERLAQWMRAQGGGVAVIPTGQAPLRSGHTPYPFRFDSQFYYLTGFTEADAWLVVVVDDTHAKSVLFCRNKDPQTEIWDGLLWGPQAAREAFGVDEAFDVLTLDDWMSKRLASAPNLFAPLQRCAVANLPARLQGWLTQSRHQNRHQTAHAPDWIDLTPKVSDLRLIKDPSEISTMREAARISALAHRQAMQAARSGLTERALEAQLLYTFLIQGAQGPAYDTIVATGANACVLHHRAGHDVIGPKDLILIDAACELDGYAADITRTFPASGRFEGAHATLYDVVLAAQQAAIDATRPGASFDQGHQAAVLTLTQGLVDEGLLQGDVSGLIEQAAYRRYYMHRTGHWLGLDVHDVGPYRIDHNWQAGEATGDADPAWVSLMPGMVLTIEPGLYIRPAPDIAPRYWNIGIRIEDNALVTQEGCELLTRGVPVVRQEIEDIMRQAK